jgi:hypothetical protein
VAEQVLEVKGAERLERTLGEFGRSLEDMADANRRAAETVGSAAVARAPKRTGRLAGSLRIDAAPTSVEVSFGASYAAPIHWGVGPRVGLRGPHNVSPTLFLTGALEAQEDSILAVYEDAVDTRLGVVKGA